MRFISCLGPANEAIRVNDNICKKVSSPFADVCYAPLV